LENIVYQPSRILREERCRLNGHESKLFWFTGLPGAGKTTLAQGVEEQLHHMGVRVYVLDGDNVRLGLCRDLGFSDSERCENLRRVGEVARLFLDAGVVCLAAFIAPLEGERKRIRSLLCPGDYNEIYVRCPIEVCESRDVKGHYRRAKVGVLQNFTGVSSAYDCPNSPDMIIDTQHEDVEVSVARAVSYILDKIHFDPVTELWTRS